MTAFSIVGAESGERFQLTVKPHCLASATFVAVHDTTIRVTRKLTDLFNLPDDTPVVAHWHGQWRTDGFAMTVGQLRALG